MDSSHPISKRKSHGTDCGGDFRLDDISDLSCRISSFIELRSHEISRSDTADLVGSRVETDASYICSN